MVKARGRTVLLWLCGIGTGTSIGWRLAPVKPRWHGRRHGNVARLYTSPLARCGLTSHCWPLCTIPQGGPAIPERSPTVCNKSSSHAVVLRCPECGLQRSCAGAYVEATACRPGRAATARATDISRQFSEPNFGVPPLTPDPFHAAPIPARHTLHALHAQHPLALYRRRRGSMRGAPARRPARPSAAARAPPLRALPCSPKPRTPYDPAVLVHRLSSRLTGC